MYLSLAKTLIVMIQCKVKSEKQHTEIMQFGEPPIMAHLVFVRSVVLLYIVAI